MANVLVRDLAEQTVDALKRRAARHGRSLQAEMKQILERAAIADMVDSISLADRIRGKLAGRDHSDSAGLVADDRGR